MSDETSQVPVAGSLSAKVIKACRVHKQCGLDCPERRVLDLGEIASFDNRPKRPLPKPTLPDPGEGIKTGRPYEPSLLDRFTTWLDRNILGKGG